MTNPVTPLSHLSDAELLAKAYMDADLATYLELELASRLEHALSVLTEVKPDYEDARRQGEGRR